MKTVSVLIPCYNEQESIDLLYSELFSVINMKKEYNWEIVFINDGSVDNTIAKLRALRAKDSRVNYIDLSRNFGKENAMLAGIDYITGDCTIIMDADLQHPPTIITDMLLEWENGFDDVYAKRLNRGKESFLRKSFSLQFYKILRKVAKIDIPQNVGDFRLLDKSCTEALKTLRERERYSKGLFAWIGYNKKELLFEQKDRIAGNSSWNFQSLLGLAIQGITSFTIAPLRLATFAGLITSAIAFVYIIFVLIKTFFYGESVQGYPTLIIAILFLGGVQLLSLGIIGEYIGKIYNESKQRPSYLIKKINDKKL